MRPPVAPPFSIVNTVEAWAPGVYRAFWEILIDSVREPVQVTSYWRDPAENRRVGGAPDSQHQLGLGIDLVFAERAAASRALSRLVGGGLVAVDEGTHVHVQAWPAGLARDVGLMRALGL